jgi:hypothetical protein
MRRLQAGRLRVVQHSRIDRGSITEASISVEPVLPAIHLHQAALCMAGQTKQKVLQHRWVVQVPASLAGILRQKAVLLRAMAQKNGSSVRSDIA